MMLGPPAWYRSVGFWLGVFVLAFLGWAWMDSLRAESALFRRVSVVRSFPMPSEYAYFHNGVRLMEGKVELCYTRVTDPLPGVRVSREPVDFRRTDSSNRVLLLLVGMRAAVPGETWPALATVKTYRVAVPMWGIVGGYVLGGAGAMVWWRRRCRRMTGGE